MLTGNEMILQFTSANKTENVSTRTLIVAGLHLGQATIWKRYHKPALEQTSKKSSLSQTTETTKNLVSQNVDSLQLTIVFRVI